MDNLQRELEETHQLHSAALAENRGLRKRLKVEREVTRGIFQGLLDPRTAERLIAHLDLFVGKSNAAAPSDDGAQGEPAEHVAELVGDLAEIFSGLERIAQNLDAARKETPDVQDVALGNSAHYVRMIAERLAQQPKQPTAAAVDAETVALLKELSGYLECLVNGHRYDTPIYVRLHDACTAAHARLRTQPAATPAKVVVDPDVLQDLAHVERILEGHVVGTGDADISHTEFVIADAVRRLRAILAKLHATA